MKISQLLLINIVLALLIQGIYYVLDGAGHSEISAASKEIQLGVNKPAPSTDSAITFQR